MSAPRVAALILAAGMSKRLGVNKLLEDVGGRPIIARVVDAFLGSMAAPVLVVVGHEAARVKQALAGRSVLFAENASFEEGLGASLREGIAAVSRLARAADGVLVALGDMPLLRAAHINPLLRAFDPHGPLGICVPIHDGRRGHPVLFSARHFAEMSELRGDAGARTILERHAGAVLAVPIADLAIFIDVDTPAMLAAARAAADEPSRNT